MKQEQKKTKGNQYLSYLFALVAHCLMFFIFLNYHISIMIYFNIASIIMYVIILLIYPKSKDRRYDSIFFALSSIEVICHQVLAIICVGAGNGFEYFLIIIGLSLILQSKNVIRKGYKIAYCTLIILVSITIQLYASSHEPIYQLPQNVKVTLLVTITTVSIFGIFFFALDQWSVSERYREQIEVLLGERNTKILEMQAKTIRNFADLVESRDVNTGGHIKRTSAYVEAIIQALSESKKYQDILTPEYSQMIISAAPLHDIGKIAISDLILQKKGKLTDDEYEVMKTHSAIGADMLGELLGDMESEEYVNTATQVAKYHHEKYNGKGYPEHLEGTQIPLCARIMAVADVFDALTSVRAYKDKFSMDKAYGIMVSESGQQFDADLIDEFVRIRPRIERLYEQLYEE